MRLYKHLDLEERAKIVLLQEQGFTAGETADELNRDASTIYRELARNRNSETGNATWL